MLSMIVILEIFVTFAPGVKCNGNVIIEDNVFVGSGVIIKNGLPNKKIIIGRNSVIGAGSCNNKKCSSKFNYCRKSG